MRSTRRAPLTRAALPGIALCALVATTATLLAAMLPLGSAPVLAIVLGVLVGALVGPRPALGPGIAAASAGLLRGAVVVLGAELSLGTVLSQGARSLPAIVLTLGGCLLVARVLTRRLAIPAALGTLVGVGTGICGASAIAAVAPVIRARELDVGYAVTTIFLFNVLAVLVFPPLGHVLGLDPHAFGAFAGTAVNDLSSVVAAANAYGDGALHTAVVVKLARTLMIIPICMVLAGRHGGASAAAGPALTTAGRDTDRDAPPPRRGLAGALALTPRFLIGFLLLAGLRSAGAIPDALTPSIGTIATLMITGALAAVGLAIDVGALRRAGARPIVLGAALWIAISSLSLAAQASGMG